MNVHKTENTTELCNKLIIQEMSCMMVIVVLKLFKEKKVIQYEPKEINPCYQHDQKCLHDSKTLF